MQGQLSALIRSTGNLFFRKPWSSSLAIKRSLLGFTLGHPVSTTTRSFSKRAPIMELPIGYDNFREVIKYQLDFVDKSLFIKEIIDDRRTEVAVITRPRRFGKTLNLSMLHHFLAPNVYGEST